MEIGYGARPVGCSFPGGGGGCCCSTAGGGGRSRRHMGVASARPGFANSRSCIAFTKKIERYRVREAYIQMAGLWPAIRRFGSDARKFAESDRIDELLRLGIYGTIFWSGMRIKKRNDASEAAIAAAEAAAAEFDAEAAAIRNNNYN
ncbi:hypothetical protein POM88_031257 [Heracleum sosnowskyi]|uniref:Uncharacterized protein n=1 Tax=Heracleum sosnowskyi TaxID=360622 RepID=A0AAD8MJL1_9APIA|nr:hypothetical protein POM88_031257 [Heracleum sosnowskyi]